MTFVSMDGSSSATVAVGSDKRQSNREASRKPTEATVKTRFLNVKDSSDGLLVGFGDLAKWAYALDEIDGDIWVNFRNLGVRLLAERSKEETQK